MNTSFPINPGSWLGVLGGGQLGKMFSEAASSMGYRVCVLEKDVGSPAGAISEKHLIAPYTDPEALKELADKCKAVTTEFENVPAESLQVLAKDTFTAPSADAVTVTQDRYVEKGFLSSNGIPVAPHKLIENEQDVDSCPEDLFPGILKTARFGYDGKGQVRVKTKAELMAAFEKLDRTRCVLEKMMPLFKEISVISARNPQGETCTFPVAENQHQNGILSITILPARIPQALADRARAIATKIVDRLNYCGVLCTEFFVLNDGHLLVNELAPRPHNSGHATIEACVTSQYGQQVRAMTGMPLGSTHQNVPAVMVNLLGNIWFDEQGKLREPPWDKVLAIHGAHLHLYGKHEPRIGRKMGHVTCTAETPEKAMEIAIKVCEIFGLPSPTNYHE
ncbi:MAG: 5-(carboxyamino)imidazole ribonucleotide synthase [Burkholderiales bacterium]|nr:5-(carboxyamino)imidazole ribonucleotide synthase [Burkholderiales bacterium]